MKRLIKKDPFFDKQPPLEFINELKEPLHKEKPAGYGKRAREKGEIDAGGIYIAKRFPQERDPKGLLETVYCDIDRFFSVYGIGGDRYPIYVEYASTECFEAYTVTVSESGITVSAEDTEGIRRALIYVEDELRRSEAPYLTCVTVSRKPLIKSRITRCFFSPINRPPKYGDELSDDIDYYPDEYLNRLMHDGANGVWIYTRFSDLMPSEYIKENGVGYEARIKKLNATVEKCARYGIGVYVFAIEPNGLTAAKLRDYPELAGHIFPDASFDPTVDNKALVSAFCVNTEKGARYCYEQGKRLVELAPGIKGFMSITQGEHTTSCVSAYLKCNCPRCSKKKMGEVLSDAVEALRSGIRDADPKIEVISWTYGARTWRFDDISDYVRSAPADVMLMQNFEEMGYEEQLGRTRQCVDYWLSYIGPSQLFKHTANRAKEEGKHMYAKMQVCSSHEISTVPYVPVPGILFKKYKAARELNVSGIMQCWYFGNYPSLMSKCAGELSFIEDFSNEREFLERIAAIYFGRSRAALVADAWEMFERSYTQYPMNIMFSYYGPMHDGVVWKLALKPKNFSLPRTWQSLDPADGDRIGDSLLDGHTLDEALTLVNGMCRDWESGCRSIEKIPIDSHDAREQISLAFSIKTLFDSGRNILEFYSLRDKLGIGEGDPSQILARMRTLVEDEIKNSTLMIEKCKNDPRLGYHSEAEGYKFFDEKLKDRIASLRELLAEEFPEVEKRVADGLSPLEYYDGVEDAPDVKTCHVARGSVERAEWVIVSEENNRRFRAAIDEQTLVMQIRSDVPERVNLAPEFRLLWQNSRVIVDPGARKKLDFDAKIYAQHFGERIDSELAKYRIVSHSDTSIDYTVTVDLKSVGLYPARPFKLKITIGGVSWCTEENPIHTLGKTFMSPGEYGWMIPEK